MSKAKDAQYQYGVDNYSDIEEARVDGEKGFLEGAKWLLSKAKELQSTIDNDDIERVGTVLIEDLEELF